MNWEVWAFRLVVVGFVGWFAQQMAFRFQLITAAPQNFRTDHLLARTDRFILEVIFQTKTIAGRPLVGLAHLGVFWGFVAFGGFTLVEGLRGVGLVDLTGERWFHVYKLLLIPCSLAVLAGIVSRGLRRGIVRPAGLGKTVSKESILIAFMISVLMVTFLVTFAIDEGS